MSELPSLFRSVERTARKQHKCCECRQEIKPGERYRYSFGIWDSKPETYKQCLTCARIMDVAVFMNRSKGNYPDEGPCFCCLIEWVCDELSQYPECIDDFVFSGNPVWEEIASKYAS